MAGANATVSSILSNPDQDPHLFEASPSVARLLAGAAIVVYNGADYDPWMAKLLSAVAIAKPQGHRRGGPGARKPGDNPHLWYDPPTMPAYAKALSATLSQRDPAHQADYDQRLRAFLDVAAANAGEDRRHCVPNSAAFPSPPPSLCSAIWRPRSASRCATNVSSLR